MEPCSFSNSALILAILLGTIFFLCPCSSCSFIRTSVRKSKYSLVFTCPCSLPNCFISLLIFHSLHKPRGLTSLLCLVQCLWVSNRVDFLKQHDAQHLLILTPCLLPVSFIIIFFFSSAFLFFCYKGRENCSGLKSLF